MIVAIPVLERLKEVGLGELEIIGLVKKPEPLSLNIPGITNKFQVLGTGVNKKDG